MWNVNGNDLKMCEGDFGLALPITISGVTFTEHDEVKIVVKTDVNGETLLTKTFSNIQHNTISFELTESETLPVGVYVYSLDWYQDGAFLCNIIPRALLKVVEKV